MGFLGTVLLWSLGFLLVLATVLPLSKLPLGLVRGLGFPRQQFLLLAVGLAIGAFTLAPGWLGGWGGPLLLILALVQLVYIAKFTPVWPVQSLRASKDLANVPAAQISLLAANVKLSNRDYDALITLIRERSPDIVMAIEVDADWIAGLRAGLADDYAEWIEVPKDNGYGMAVLSRLPLSDSDVRELVTRDVPSICTTISLRNGCRIRLYVVHPEPPVISHDTCGRDSEIALVGMEAQQDDLPAIVAGDLNDVAWSTTTRRFQRLSGLADPRVGRGFYNTFDATRPWMRWPLDHLFHDPRFRLIDMARLRRIGSDHFPMWFTLALTSSTAETFQPGHPDAAEVEEAKRMIDKEQQRRREPIGSDWESG